MNKLSSPVERNKEPILNILKQYLLNQGRLLEIGSGTGQHAIFFAKFFKDLDWVCSDVKGQQIILKKQFKQARIKNIHGPEVLQVGIDDFPKTPFDYVYTANTLHIMSWKENKSLFKLLGKRLREGSLVFIYGPFNYNGEFTSLSNKDFNSFLKNKNVKSGIRGFEEVFSNMKKSGFKLLKDHEMPTNNRLLVFERLPFVSSKK